MPGGKHEIYIFQEGNEYRVRPAMWSYDGQGNPKVKFRNLTPYPVQLVVPGDLASAGSPTSQTLGPPSSGAASVWELNLKAKANGTAERHRYAALVETPVGFVMAVGESEPVIIIDPPPI